MSFGLPSLKSKPEHASKMGFVEGTYGVPDLMTCGLASSNPTQLDHPLIQSEQKFAKNRENLNMVLLRNTQGLHAPLRLAMEMKAVKKVGHLPFLLSHNVMLDSLTGQDLNMGPEDIFNTAEFREVMGQPHAVVERSLGLL